MDAPDDGTDSVFVSVHHPEGRPYPLVFSQQVIRPISVLFLPLMVITLMAALQQAPVMNILLWGFPMATALAFVWTAFKLRGDLAEIRLIDRTIALRSVHDVALRGDGPARMMPLFDVRDYGDWLIIAAGDADYVIARDSWEDYEVLRRELRGAVYST